MDKGNGASGRTSAEGQHYWAKRNGLEEVGESESNDYGELAKHVGVLRNSLSRYTADPNRLDDFVQESMLEALKSVRARGPPRNPRSWLLRVGHRTAWRAARRELRYTGAEFVDDRVREDEQGPYAAAENSDLGACLSEAMGSLSDGDRHLLEGLYLQGRSCLQLAGEAGISRENVRTRLYRARQRLRSYLAGSRDVFGE